MNSKRPLCACLAGVALVPMILALCTVIVFARRVPVRQEETPTQPAEVPLRGRGRTVDYKGNAIRLSTVQAGNGFADMESLAKIVGDARIVALGEATHGTREFCQLKHRMVARLFSHPDP